MDRRFLFVPSSVWVIYVCAIRGPYSGKVVGVAYAAGALTHVLLFAGYGLFKNGLIGSAGLLVYAGVIGHADHLGGHCEPVRQA